MGLDSIVSVNITTQTTSVARKSFGKPLLVAYFPTSVFGERTREYTTLSGMLGDGHLATDAAYLMASALKAQNPSVKSWKVGRRAGASIQTLRLTPTITTEGEVLSLTIEGTEVSYTIPAAATVNSIATAMTALIAAVTGVTAADGTGYVTITPKNIASCIVTVTAASSKTFTITLDGVDFTYTSDSDATAAEIRDGLQALIIAGGYVAAEVVDKDTDALTFTFASHAGADLRVSCSGGALVISAAVLANRLLSVADISTGMTFKDNTPDPSTGIATDLAAIVAFDTDFYGLGIDCESEAQIAAVAYWAETQKTLYVPSNMDTENKTGATTDVGTGLKTAGYARTGLLHNECNSQYGGLRWLGRMLPKDPGSATFAYKKLAGNTVSPLSEPEEGFLDSKNINHCTTVGGVAVTQKGYSASGEFLDITWGSDWFQARLQERIWYVLVNNDKLTYEEAGELFRAQILAQLEEGLKKRFIAPNTEDTPWVIDIPEVGDIDPSERAARNYPDINFSAYIAGAVHTLEIQGTLSA